ncbi:MAG: hypothetical protein KAH09_11450 [Desulfobacula sp.]|nr:hypothetical protein [Desulfobacula sp.]
MAYFAITMHQLNFSIWLYKIPECCYAFIPINQPCPFWKIPGLSDNYYFLKHIENMVNEKLRVNEKAAFFSRFLDG